MAKDAVRKPEWVREMEEACDKGVKSALRKLRAEERKQLKSTATYKSKFESVAEVAEALRIYADLVNGGRLIPSDHDMTDYAKRFEDAHGKCVRPQHAREVRQRDELEEVLRDLHRVLIEGVLDEPLM